MELYFATQNQGKVTEADQILRQFGIRVLPVPFNFRESTAGTTASIAQQKLAQIKEQGYQRVMVEDSGIYFAAYQHFPGVLSKRVFQGIGYAGLERLLQGVSRQAWFEGSVAVHWHGHEGVFSATMSGQMIDPFPHNPQPEPGHPFDPLFVVTGETIPFQQLSIEKRLHYSYRRMALLKMVQWIHRLKS